MKKIVLWFMSTLTVVMLLFGYHTSTSSAAAASAESSAVAPLSSGTGAASASTGSTSSGSSTGSTSSSSASSSTSPGGSTATTTTFTGDAASTKYGPVQVQITVADGTVTDVTVVDYPNSNGKDRQINARALPVLVQETVDAQSAKIDMVSGATYTSDGYVESLQSALDEAGL